MASHDNGNVTEYGTRPRKSILKLRDGNTMPLIPLNDTNGQEPARIINRRVSFAEKVKLHQIDLIHFPQHELSGSDMDDSDDDSSFLKLEADADEIVNELLTSKAAEIPELTSDEDDAEDEEQNGDEEQTMELTGQIKVDYPVSDQDRKTTQDLPVETATEDDGRKEENFDEQKGPHNGDEPERHVSGTQPEKSPEQIEAEMEESDMEFTEPLNVPMFQDLDPQDQEETTMDVTKFQFNQPEATTEPTVELTMEITSQYDIPQLSSALGSEDDQLDEQPPVPNTSSPFQIPLLEPLTDNSDENDSDVPMEFTQQLPATEQDSPSRPNESEKSGSRTEQIGETSELESEHPKNDPDQRLTRENNEEQEMELTATIGDSGPESLTNDNAAVSEDIQENNQKEVEDDEVAREDKEAREDEVEDQEEVDQEMKEPDEANEESEADTQVNNEENQLNSAAELKEPEPEPIPEPQAESNPQPDREINTPVSNSLPNGKRARLNEKSVPQKQFHKETTTTTTIPLADVSMTSTGDTDSDIPIVSLTEFLTAIGIKFYDDLEFSTDISNRYRLSISDAHGPLSQEDYYRANIQLPVLEVFELCCKELSEKIKQGKKLFDELKTETLQHNPEIFREYFKASFYDQMTMKSRFHTSKEYTRQQAKQIWYRWRATLIENILDVLKGNLELLESDKATLIEQISSLDTISHDIQLLYHSIRLDILQFKDIQTRFQDLDTSQLTSIKSKLADLNQQLIDHKAQITQKETELKRLQDEIEEKNSFISDLKRQIAASDSKLSQTRTFNSAEIGDLQFKSSMLQAGAGLEFVKEVEGKTFEFDFNPRIKVTIDFSEPTLPQSITLLLLNNSKEEVLYNDYLLVNYCQKLAEQTGFTNIYDSFVSFRRKWLKLTEVDRDIYQISVKYPVEFNVNDDYIDFTFRYYSFEQKQKANCNVTIPLDTILEYPNNVIFKVILYESSPKNEWSIKRQITSDSMRYLMFRSLQEVEN